MKIKRFTESLNSSLKNNIEDAFIDFIDLGILDIKQRDINEYGLYFNFNLPEPTSEIETLDNLIKISEYLVDIKTSVLRLKEYYSKVDVSCDKTISIDKSLSPSQNYYVGIIDSSELDYEKLSNTSYKAKLKNKTELDNVDIIKVYNALNINNNVRLWLRGWSGGRNLIVITDSLEELDNLETNPKLLQCQMSIDRVRILDFDLYKLNSGDFIIKLDNYILLQQKLILYNSVDKYLIENNMLEKFISEKVKEYLNLWSREYPRLERYL